MKILLFISIVFLFSGAAAYADDEDSAMKKAAKLTVLKEGDDDSVTKKAVQLDATKDIIDDEDDSTMKKAVKLKMLEEASE
jgi:hypothetical protein